MSNAELIAAAKGEMQALDLPASVKELLYDMADALETAELGEIDE